jgi:predicted phosphoribosyltransferase
MVAALRAVRALHPALVIAAAPVMSRSAREVIMRHADGTEAVVIPDPFFGVGAWYDDFTQTSDEEVRVLLHEAYARRPVPDAALQRNGWARVV